MKLYAAPLQGFTEAPWRNLHQEVCADGERRVP